MSPSNEFCPELIDKAISHGMEIAADASQWLVRPGAIPEPCPDPRASCVD